ncbi:MAG: branched-chain amino acid aminotransferase, branched-chain amino acid aminotransferase [Candidatus Peregrinibacteria bacterium GW2011_GWE2_39_6]|nr:MAG: branched-chain amino acid aminotransferase, branched-chain amino acid aminotransferase [Candidatus Peregrinibacteria bacterium GW2011_GWF2_39_17]KKR25851.1 MAG: branched-chain amino acid aminotransferase, branched-chain amino acid aminotransferase [Candidatus Peregrinibacteria bacterium GW2011_GWE2_39_6]HCW32326.1 branched chain amino acid aminotransferase [Candidatus Peregrinibacteria bacterium]
MKTTEFIWLNGQWQAWDQAKIHVLSHTLHYGAGVFEGIRCYKTSKGTAIFRLNDHLKRLFYSAKVIDLKIPYSLDELSQTTKETVRKNKLEQGYIRPLAFFGYGKMGLNPIGAPVETLISCWPWEKYLAEEAVKAKISPYIRLHPKSVISDAKVCGHYVNSILASLDAKKTGYHEAILLDYQGNVAEGPGENIFLIKNGIIKTPPLGNILNGITRDTIITLARDLGYKVREETITPKHLYAADEAFFTGTAAEIAPIASVDNQIFGNGQPGFITQKLKEIYMNVVFGRNNHYDHYLDFV